MHQQMIKDAIQAVLIDLLIAELQQVRRRYQSSAMCSSLDGSQNRAATSTTAIFAQPMRSLPFGKRRSQLLQSGPAPQCEGQIHIAKLARSFNANALQPNRNGQCFATVLEQWRWFRSADHDRCRIIR